MTSHSMWIYPRQTSSPYWHILSHTLSIQTQKPRKLSVSGAFRHFSVSAHPSASTVLSFARGLQATAVACRTFVRPLKLSSCVMSSARTMYSASVRSSAEIRASHIPARGCCHRLQHNRSCEEYSLVSSSQRIFHPLSNVLRVVADTLVVLGNHQQVDGL